MWGSYNGIKTFSKCEYLVILRKANFTLTLPRTELSTAGLRVRLLEQQHHRAWLSSIFWKRNMHDLLTSCVNLLTDWPVWGRVRWFGFGLIHFTSMLARWPHDSYVDGQSQIKVHTDERTQVHSARSSLVVTHPRTDRGRRALIVSPKNVYKIY